MAESVKLRFALVLFVFFLISGWYSFQELRYLLSARVAEATVDRVEIREERVYRRRYRSGTRQFQLVTVHFAGGNQGAESLTLRLPMGHQYHPQQTLKVQYIPGETDMTRLSGSGNWISVVFFLGSLIAFTGMIVWVGLEANRPYAGSRLQADDRPVSAIQPKKKKRKLTPLKPIDEA